MPSLPLVPPRAKSDTVLRSLFQPHPSLSKVKLLVSCVCFSPLFCFHCRGASLPSSAPPITTPLLLLVPAVFLSILILLGMRRFFPHTHYVTVQNKLSVHTHIKHKQYWRVRVSKLLHVRQCAKNVVQHQLPSSDNFYMSIGKVLEPYVSRASDAL